MDTRFHLNPTYANDVQLLMVDANAPDLLDIPGLQLYVDHIGATQPIGTEDASTPTYAAFVANYVGLNPFPVDIVVGKDGNITYIAREYDGNAMQLAIDAAMAVP